jgi:hypothetical protein
MKPSLRLLATMSLVCAASGVALAQAPSDTEELPPPAPPPPSAPIYAPRPVYQAPLAQTTQTTYVPQSIALSGPKQIVPEDDNQAPPDGYSVAYRRRTGYLIAGPITFGVPYFYSALIAAVGHDSGSSSVDPLIIPVVGPFLEMGNTNGSWTADLLLAVDGAAQVAGAVMIYKGLTSKKRVFMRNDLVSNTMVLPTANAHGGGFALTGRF